jgi:hypothetical protein
MFVRHACQPIVSALLGGSVIGDTSVVDYPNVAVLLADLSSARGHLNITRGTAWPLVVAFLSTIPREVTRLSAKEACEDFPLSVPLYGSSWVSSFSASSYSLFVSIPSWEEVFGFCHSCPGSSWGRIHCVWVPLRVLPLVTERPPGSSGWQLLCFEVIRPVSHMDVYSLLIDGR